MWVDRITSAALALLLVAVILAVIVLVLAVIFPDIQEWYDRFRGAESWPPKL
jgi:hypothetical protein